MASKPAIPAWQRAPIRPTQAELLTEGQNETEKAAKEDAPPPSSEEDDVSDDSGGPAEQSVDSHLEQVEALLEDPSVKDASSEKKRAFLASKSVPEETIDRVVKPTDQAISASAFSTFKEQERSSPQAPMKSVLNASPPIITYPEFLVEAHKPPPLITPARLIGASYFVGGLATLIYAANKTIVGPMVDALTDARHDFSIHSQSKLDEFNDRLAKIVTKVPEPKSTLPSDFDGSETESITSDPTELYHRDMGTQTSEPEAALSFDSLELEDASKKDVVTRHTNDLTTIRDRLAELADGMENPKDSETERQDNLTTLRSYLDTLMYTSPVINMWSNTEDSAAAKHSSTDDAIEELKKEIRGVKGVLLSSRRFPSTGMGRTV